MCLCVCVHIWGRERDVKIKRYVKNTDHDKKVSIVREKNRSRKRIVIVLKGCACIRMCLIERERKRERGERERAVRERAVRERAVREREL